MVGRRTKRILLTTLLALGVSAASLRAVEVQDIARLKGAESSKIVGMGLVIGLEGTGDGGDFAPAIRPLAAMMQRLMDPNVVAHELRDVKNVAVVSISAKLPASGVREGDEVDIQIASVGPAKSLKGGRLFLTPMYGPKPGMGVFAYAEGRLQFEDAETETVATIKRGATITRNVLAQSTDELGRMTLVLDEPNATWPMANTLTQMINDELAPDGPPIALAADQKNILVQVPANERRNPANFISRVLELHIDPSLVRTEARVVINERTGTIVMTSDVEISPVVISHQGLTITTITPPRVPTAEQPSAETTDFVALDPQRRGGAKLADLLAAFNQLKVPAEDRIAILKRIHTSGKLHAKLVLED